jgi:hypothetical protein
MRYLLIVLSMMLCTIAFAQDEANIDDETRDDDAEFSDDNVRPSDDNVGSSDVGAESSDVEVDSPGVDLDIDVPEYPEMAPVPDYPVYYAPQVNSNYFFYDGLYWVYWEDNWYMSSWYKGPWQLVAPVEVPLFVLRVPLRYYRRPPVYFHGWREDAPPRWGLHWGREWEERRHGWDRWDHSRVPHAAPLPVYQRSYSGDRYPHAAQQRHSIRTEHYRYQPHETITQQHFQQQHNTGSSHAGPHMQAPVRRRSSTQNEHWQPNQQPQHLKPLHSQPAQPIQHTPQIRPMHHTQPMQSSPQLQHSPTIPQDRSREIKKQEHHEDHH